MRRYTTIAVYVLILTGCGPSLPMQPKYASGIVGTWNISSYETIDSIEFEWYGSVLDLGEDGKCLTPGREGVAFSLDDGTWRAIDDSTFEMSVKDTLLNGTWHVHNAKRSTVKGYEEVVLEATICNERTPLCFNLFKKF